MKISFTPNLTRAGRIVRGLWAALLFAVAAWACAYSAWVATVLALAGALAAFEAARGWCLLRACGVRTRL